MREILNLPGAIDLHVHLREPSTLNKSETIAGGTRAARLGGNVLVVDMPNNPGLPVWTLPRLNTKIDIGRRKAELLTAFYAGLQPEADNIGELEAMSKTALLVKGYGGITTNNDNEYEAEDFREGAVEWDRVAHNKPYMFHPGENNLAEMIAMVAGELGHPFHVCHVHSSEQVALVTAAKKKGWPVTCGVCPHHLLKTSFDERTQGTFAQMMPPLADQLEAEKLMQLLEAGYIDIIESDFAPHSIDDKLKAENEGGECRGVPGIESIHALLLYQVHKGRLSYKRYVEATHDMPLHIAGLKAHPLTKIVWDTRGGVYRIGESDIEASCGWGPYMGMLALGKVVKTVIRGVEATGQPGWEPITVRGEAV